MPKDYALFNVCIRGTGPERYTIDVHSPLGGDATALFIPPIGDPAYRQLTDRLHRLDTDEDVLVELGQILFRSIFQGSIKDVYARSQGRLAPDQGLRVRLDIDPALVDIAILPWEFLYDPDQGPLALLDAPVVRYIPQQAPTPLLPAPLPLKVLLTGAVTPPEPDVERELAEVRAALAELEAQGYVSIQVEDHLTQTILQRRLREGFHIWHFIGHGAYSRDGRSGTLVFEDATGSSKSVSAPELNILLNRSGLRLVMLDACDSAKLTTDPYRAVAPALVRAQVPAVVAMQFTVPQVATRAFAAEFYRTLAEGFPIDACVTEGRKAIMNATGLRTPDWGIPVVYTRAQDGHLFTLPAPDRSITSSPFVVTSTQTRLDRLIELSQLSVARCVERWQAAGVARHPAIKLANDPSIGTPTPALAPNTEKPLLILIGEIGTGKSLIAERLFQKAVTTGREKDTAPVPIFLDARSIGKLQEAAEEAAKGVGDLRSQGAAIIVDGADEAGIGSAAVLLSQARVLVSAWPNTTIVITSRPIPTLVGQKEAIKVPFLSEQEASSLISRFAGRMIRVDAHSWLPESVQEAVRRPLFALLLGIYLQEQTNARPRSIGELLSHLVERSLGRVTTDRASADLLLQKLAVLCTERDGGFVHAAEVAPKAELLSLLDSGLIIERGGAVGFALPILTEWFAAHSLATGTPTPTDLVINSHRLERWRYPLIIFTGLFSHDQVSSVLTPLAEHDPAFVAEIVQKGLTRHGLEESMLPPPEECGRRMRVAMRSWIYGIGPLAQIVAPISKDGTLLSIGVQVEGIKLTVAWYQGNDSLPEVVQFPQSIRMADQLSHSWPKIQRVTPGHQPAWVWHWALDELVDNLSQALQQRALPVNEGPLVPEAVWQVALELTGQRTLSLDPILLSEIEAALSQLPKNVVQIRSGARWYDLNLLRVELERLKNVGATAMHAPWPGPDRDLVDKGVCWDPADERTLGYTDERVVARVNAVYTGAIEGYQRLVERWFPNLSPRLRTAVLFPARLVGVIMPPREFSPFASNFAMTWYWEALPRGSQNMIDLHLDESDPAEVDLDVLREHLHALRPEAAGWISMSVHSGGFDELFHDTPMTDLVYTWLWEDLKQVSWVQGHLLP